MDTTTKVKGWLGEMKKQFTWMLVAVVIGFILGSLSESNRIYSDCRYAGVTRIGHSAFKCDQFSKAVLLTPDEVVKK
jgi:hypothetical protein